MNDLEIIKEKLDELGTTQALMLEALQSITNTLGNMNEHAKSQLKINEMVLRVLRPSR